MAPRTDTSGAPPVPAAIPPVDDPPRLSLVEQLVLALIAEGPTYGFALARVVGRDGPIGRLFEVPRPVVYRAVDRLVAAGLARPVRVEAGDHGPRRTVVTVTPAGQRISAAWLAAPVDHVRDIRTELLVKLALLERFGRDPAPLLTAQRAVLLPIAEALGRRCGDARGPDRPVAVWRHETALAALRFVDRYTS